MAPHQLTCVFLLPLLLIGMTDCHIPVQEKLENHATRKRSFKQCLNKNELPYAFDKRSRTENGNPILMFNSIMGLLLSPEIITPEKILWQVITIQ